MDYLRFEIASSLSDGLHLQPHTAPPSNRAVHAHPPLPQKFRPAPPSLRRLQGLDPRRSVGPYAYDYGLTPDGRTEHLPSGTQTRLVNRLCQATIHLVPASDLPRVCRTP